MILATRSGNREVRFGEALARIPSPTGLAVAAGQAVTYDSAAGLAAVGRAIRLVSGITAAMPIRVYEGRRGDKRERPETPQARLLEAPMGAGTSDFDWRWDIFSSLEICENAFLLKRKDRRGIVELEYIPHYAVTARVNRDNGEREYDVRTVDGKRTFSQAEILHVRGQTVGGGPFGVSRITQHRDPLGALLAAQRFEGAYYRNHARPDVAFVFPERMTRAEVLEWRPEIEAMYGGAENFGKPIPLGGGVDIKTVPINLQDAQFIETRKMGLDDIGRIMDVDPVLLGADGDRKQALQMFLNVQLPARLRRVERAFKADADLFGGSPLYPECEVNELMFADPLTRAQVQHYRVQDGTELVDEARADNGRGPLPPIPADPAQEPGKVPQLTPVGGAPSLPIPSGTEE